MTELNRDPLTGLLNRHYLQEELPAVIGSYIQENNSFTVVMLDLDHFKTVNDVYGHARGDQVLKSFAHFLERSMRKADKVIRFGGDEFLCIMPDCGRLNAEVIYDRIIEKCREEEFDGLHASISVGLASYPDDGDNYEKLFDAADASLYEAKRSGRDRIGTTQKKQITIPIKAFINRRDETNSLLQKINSDLDQPQFIVINGNAGVGKTRLVRESLNMTNNYEIIWSNCMLFSESIAYYVIRELTKYRIKRRGVEIFNELPTMYRLEMGKLVPEIIEDHYDEINNMNLVLDRYRLYESVRKSIEIGAQPKAIVIDNFQWIDKESLEVLRYLIQSLKDSRILFILINRIEDSTGMVFDFLAETSREATVEEIDLRPLPVAEVRECVRAIIGDEPSDKLVRYAFQTVGGNPYYLEELFRALSTEECLTLKNDQWQFQVPQNPLVPKSIEYIALTKYERLSAESQRVLQFASIIGHFGIRTLRFLTGYGESELQGLLAYIKRAGVLRESQGKLIFVDEFSRQAIYKKHVRGKIAKKLHLQVAHQLELDFRGRESEVVDELAQNYYLAQDKKMTVKYSLLAGKQAQEKYANEDALRYYSWAEEMLVDQKGNEENYFFTLLAREQINNLLGDRDAQQQDLNILEEMANASNYHHQVKIALRRAEYYQNIGKNKEAIESSTKAILMAIKNDDENSQAMGHFYIGTCFHNQSDYQEARIKFEKSLLLARQSGDRKLEADILSATGLVDIYQGNYSESQQYYRDSLSIYIQIGDRSGEIMALNSLGLAKLDMGKYEQAQHDFEMILQIAQEIGYRKPEASGWINLGEIYNRQGMHDEAKSAYEQGMQIATLIDLKTVQCGTKINLGLLYHHLGNNEKAVKFCNDGIEIAKEIDEQRWLGYGLTNLGHALLDLGQITDAQEAYLQAIGIRRKLQHNILIFESLAGLGRVYLALGEIKDAQSSIEEIIDYIKNNNLEGADEPLRIYLTCYQILKANQDQQASLILNTAYHLLQEQAKKIEDENLRALYLNVRYHNEILLEHHRISKNND